jgi:hypothetical protein
LKNCAEHAGTGDSRSGYYAGVAALADTFAVGIGRRRVDDPRETTDTTFIDRAVRLSTRVKAPGERNG